MNMKDSEVWGILAETMNGAQSMFPTDYEEQYTLGLCHTLYAVCNNGLINERQMTRMIDQMKDKYRGKTYRQKTAMDGYYWSPGDWKERVKACRALMKDCLEKGL